MTCLKPETPVDEMLAKVDAYRINGGTLPITLQPINPGDGDHFLGSLDDDQIGMFILICLLKVDLEEARKQFISSQHANQGGNSSCDPNGDSTSNHADLIEHLEWLIYNLDRILHIQLEVKFCPPSKILPPGLLSIRQDYIVVIETEVTPKKTIQWKLWETIKATLQLRHFRLPI